MDLKTLNSAVEQIAAEKSISAEKVLTAIETAIAAAYKKEYQQKSEIIRAKFDLKSGDLKFWQIKIVVDPKEVRFVEEQEDEEKSASSKKKIVSHKEEKKEDDETLLRYNPDRHLLFEEAKEIIEERISRDNKPSENSSLNDLEKLAELKEKGIITEEEFKGKKKQLLGL